jgi:hypothetical protein
MDIEIDQVQWDVVDEIQRLGGIRGTSYLATSGFKDSREGMAQSIFIIYD